MVATLQYWLRSLVTERGEYSALNPTSPAVGQRILRISTTFSGFDVVAPDKQVTREMCRSILTSSLKNAGKLVIAAEDYGGDGSCRCFGVEPVGPTLGAGINGIRVVQGLVASLGYVVYPNRNGGATTGGSICGAPLVARAVTVHTVRAPVNRESVPLQFH